MFRTPLVKKRRSSVRRNPTERSLQPRQASTGARRRSIRQLGGKRRPVAVCKNRQLIEPGRRHFTVAAAVPLAPVGADMVLDSLNPAAVSTALQNQQQSEQKPVDLNSATAQELQKVPGIGEALAQRIVAFREEHGPFEKVDDLLNVRGIGATSLEKLRPHLTVKPVK